MWLEAGIAGLHGRFREVQRAGLPAARSGVLNGLLERRRRRRAPVRRPIQAEVDNSVRNRQQLHIAGVAGEVGSHGLQRTLHARGHIDGVQAVKQQQVCDQLIIGQPRRGGTPPPPFRAFGRLCSPSRPPSSSVGPASNSRARGSEQRLYKVGPSVQYRPAMLPWRGPGTLSR